MWKINVNYFTRVGKRKISHSPTDFSPWPLGGYLFGALTWLSCRETHHDGEFSHLFAAYMTCNLLAARISSVKGILCGDEKYEVVKFEALRIHGKAEMFGMSRTWVEQYFLFCNWIYIYFFPGLSRETSKVFKNFSRCPKKDLLLF